MTEQNQNAEEIGKAIGSAAKEVFNESDNSDENQTRRRGDNSDDNEVHSRGESGLGGHTEDGVPLRKDGQPDGRSVSPNRGGRDQDDDQNTSNR